jgi:hypothetical protein
MPPDRRSYDMLMDSKKHRFYRANLPDQQEGGWLACSGPNAIRPVETTRVPLAAKAAVARLIGTDGTQEVNLAQCRPQHIRKVELTVHALPKQKT